MGPMQEQFLTIKIQAALKRLDNLHFGPQSGKYCYDNKCNNNVDSIACEKVINEKVQHIS